MSETPNKFSPEVRARAVRPAPVREGGPPSRRAAVASISAKIGRVPQPLHERVKKAEAGNGKRSGVPADAAEVLTAPERGNRELRQAGGIVRKASAWFAPPIGDCGAITCRAAVRSPAAGSSDDRLH